MMVAWTRTLCHALRVLMLWKLHEITYVHHILPHLTLTDSLVPWIAGDWFFYSQDVLGQGQNATFQWWGQALDLADQLCGSQIATLCHVPRNVAFGGGGKILLFCFLLELWVDSGGCVSKLATSIDFCPWKQLFDKGFAQGGWGKRGRWWLILFDTPRSEICGISTVIHNLLSSGPTFTSVLQGGAGKYAWELQHQVSSWSSLDALTWMKSDLLLW